MLIGAPLAPSLDHLGVLARTVDDIGLLLGGLAAPVPEAAESGLRVGWLGGWFEAVLGEDVRATMRRTRAVLEDGGFRIDDVIVADEPLMPAAVLARIQTEAGAFHRTAFEADPSGFGEARSESVRRTHRGT